MKLTKLYKVTYEDGDETITDVFTGLQLWIWQSRIEKGIAKEKIVNVEEV